MIRIKIDKNKKEQPIFKIYIKDIEGYKFLKRSLLEGKKISGKYNYEIPLRFFVPIFNNINKNEINLDSNSKLEFLEFWDEVEEKYYSTLEVTPKFMKLWREEGCPDIFKVKIHRETLELKKEVVFKKINPFK